MEWKKRMSEELENAMNDGDMERAVNILADLKTRGVRLRIDCVGNREESKRQESIHSISPRKAPSPHVSSAARESVSRTESMNQSFSSASSHRASSHQSVKPFVMENPVPVKPLSPVKKPTFLEHPVLYKPAEKEQDDGSWDLLIPSDERSHGTVSAASKGFTPPPVYSKPKEQDDVWEVFTPPDERSPDSINPLSTASKGLVPTPPAWNKPKEQAVQEYHSIRSQISEYPSSVSYSKFK